MEKSVLSAPKEPDQNRNYLSFELGKLKASANGPVGVLLLAFMIVTLALIGVIAV